MKLLLQVGYAGCPGGVAEARDEEEHGIGYAHSTGRKYCCGLGIHLMVIFFAKIG